MENIRAEVTHDMVKEIEVAIDRLDRRNVAEMQRAILIGHYSIDKANLAPNGNIRVIENFELPVVRLEWPKIKG